MMTTHYKSFVSFIKEELESEDILNLIVKYNIKPNEIVFKAPSNYSEDQLIQYVQDLWFAELPGGPETLEEIFGVNGEHLIDVYLEYDGFSHSKDEIRGDKLIDWDSQKDPDNDQELEYFSVKHMKYCLSFDKFELKLNPGANIKNTITKIFKTYESNSMNKYPIEIELDRHSIEFKEDNL